MKYFVYILKCRSGRLYTGITTDMARRLSEHSSGVKGAKFTRADPPESVEALWSCEGRSAASKLESAIKRLTRSRKMRLIADDTQFSDIIPELPADLYHRETP